MLRVSVAKASFNNSRVAAVTFYVVTAIDGQESSTIKQQLKSY